MGPTVGWIKGTPNVIGLKSAWTGLSTEILRSTKLIMESGTYVHEMIHAEQSFLHR